MKLENGCLVQKPWSLQAIRGLQYIDVDVVSKRGLRKTKIIFQGGQFPGQTLIFHCGQKKNIWFLKAHRDLFQGGSWNDRRSSLKVYWCLPCITSDAAVMEAFVRCSGWEDDFILFPRVFVTYINVRHNNRVNYISYCTDSAVIQTMVIKLMLLFLYNFEQEFQWITFIAQLHE